MRGGRRWALTILVVGLGLGSMPGFAQSTDPQAATPPSSDGIGPRDLQNFSLSGNVVKPADQPPPKTSTVPSAPVPSDATPLQTLPVRRPAAAQTRLKPGASEGSARPTFAASSSNLAHDNAPAASLPTLQGPTSTIVRPLAVAPPQVVPVASSPNLPDHRFLLWPWLLAAVIIAAASALLWRRNHQRHAFAGGPELDRQGAAEPHPIPAGPSLTPRAHPPRPELIPAPIPAPTKVTPGGGLISSRLRPWIEVAVQPLRCIVEDHRVTVEFDLELFNSGNAPARAVLAEAAIFNAGSAQDEEIGGFIERPVGAGERLDVIAPLQRISLRSQVVAPRESVQVFEVGGRQVFVPLVAFNALYRWSGGEGQSSVSYLLGRETKNDKLAPFRVDLGPRVFRGLGARALPLGART